MEPQPRPAEGLHRLLSAAVTERMVRQRTLDDMEDGYSTSIDIIVGYAAEYPDNWSRFLDFLKVSQESIDSLVDKSLQKDEPRAVRMVTPNEMNGLTQEDADKINRHPAPVSHLVNVAMRATTKEAKEFNDLANPGRFMQILLDSECQARSLFLKLVPADRLTDACPALVVETLDMPTYDIVSIKAKMDSMMERMWPKIQEEINVFTPKIDEQKEKLFASNPEKYTTRINLPEYLSQPPLEPRFEFLQQCGACLAAAENEARIRKAPEVTIDHLFFSLLQDGLETTALLGSKGVDWQTWRSELDERIPSFEGEGVRFPPKARDLIMNMPADQVLPEIRPLREYMDENRIEEWKHDIEASHKNGRPRQFSDALWLFGCLNVPKSLSYGYLTKAEITVDDVKAVTDN